MSTSVVSLRFGSTLENIAERGSEGDKDKSLRHAASREVDRVLRLDQNCGYLSWAAEQERGMSLLMMKSLALNEVVEGSRGPGSKEVRSNSVIIARVSTERPKDSDQS